MTGIELFALPLIGSVTTGGVLSAAALAAGTYATYAAAQQQKAGSNAQAAAMTYNAQQVRQTGAAERGAAEAEAARTGDQTRRRQATAFNTLAGAGVNPQTGTALDLMADLAGEAALDQEIIRWRGRQAQAARERGAVVQDWQAEQTRRAGSAGFNLAMINTGTSLLTRGISAFGSGGSVPGAAPSYGGTYSGL